MGKDAAIRCVVVEFVGKGAVEACDFVVVRDVKVSSRVVKLCFGGE